MRLTDNQQEISKDEFVREYPKLSSQLLDRDLKSLANEENVFVFPVDFQESDDLEKDGKLFETLNSKIKTGNVIGFLGLGEENLTIHSRFAQDDDDYFLHYMLQKVLHVNVTNLEVGLSWEEQLYQLLVYLLPKYLKNALRKGFYKEYQRFSYNDNHVKAQIDVARHIKQNSPFVGNIAYATREFTYDNALNQLIRHTLAVLKTQHGSIFDDVKEEWATLVNVTPTYRLGDKQKIIRENIKHPIRHSYYHEYAQLQRLCLMILQDQKHGFTQSTRKIHGILFDVAWLWEEYLATLLPDFIHPRNKKSEDGISVFSDRTRTVYPDFYSKEKKLVLDAKYKKLEFTKKGMARNDLYQLISYAYILQSETAGLIFPSKERQVETAIGKLAGYGATLGKWSIQIPQGSAHYEAFVNEIHISEMKFQEKIDELLTESEII